MINRIIISLCLVFSISFLSAEDKPWWEIGIETEDNQKLEELEIKVDQNAKNIEAILKEIKKLNSNKPTANNNQRNKRKPAAPNYVHKIEQGDSYFKGNPDAKVTITEFFDFQ